MESASNDRARILSRFLAKVNKGEEFSPGACWEWVASLKGESGYGQFYFDPEHRTEQAHRAAYVLLVGEIPNGLELDHLCRNRRCVTPAHIEPVTRRENLMRGANPRLRKNNGGLCVNGHPASSGDYVRTSGYAECRGCIRERSARQRTSRGVA